MKICVDTVVFIDVLKDEYPRAQGKAPVQSDQDNFLIVRNNS